MTDKPVVGIPADRRMLGVHPFHCIGEKYITAVVDGADAYAILIPSLGDRQSLAQTLSLVDGLLFTGSPSMVHPKHYQGPTLDEDTCLDPHRDDTTLPLIRQAIALGMPVFGICRGFQEMNVAFGGTLLQKIHETPGKLDHREDKDADLDVQYGPAHPVSVVAGGLIARLTGLSEFQVNSIHQQGVDRLGTGLMAEAIAPDGLVEAFSVADAKHFALATQWHPEWKHQANPVSVKLFAAFGEACRTFKRERGLTMNPE
ncbi:putative glutamine amidotransferase [Chitinivorax tropicus]|uniref:gamma-glutamyl-gamma-aminobutyrate hydrolase n=1 Tax=Chitinivorax tropicus TaxID=714531 RepID=A0A840ML66_9PROT|nr:gamma-glutamyl-gamma-aminobutyrate hydrolase family protein [Chitinivorax tropicus]MBB5019904.1 putative glutamine amidotransferase [Chitinivorax tropicus]